MLLSNGVNKFGSSSSSIIFSPDIGVRFGSMIVAAAIVVDVGCSKISVKFKNAINNTINV